MDSTNSWGALPVGVPCSPGVAVICDRTCSLVPVVDIEHGMHWFMHDFADLCSETFEWLLCHMVTR